jgi:propane monooxygenase reductase subunit
VAVEALTHDIRFLRLKATGEPLEFKPGQYVDVHIPGSDEHRSFSMANADPSTGELDFMIKLYPGGRFSGLLDDGSIKPGDELQVTGPYGVFTLRNSSRRLLFIGGGAGMAPILSLLRSLAAAGSPRPATYYYGARSETDLFGLDELAGLPATFVPALSEDTNGWAGECGLITDVVGRCEGDCTDVDAYVCGPPPMVEAAIALLEASGVPEERIHFDKFTTTAEE